MVFLKSIKKPFFAIFFFYEGKGGGLGATVNCAQRLVMNVQGCLGPIPEMFNGLHAELGLSLHAKQAPQALDHLSSPCLTFLRLLYLF